MMGRGDSPSRALAFKRSTKAHEESRVRQHRIQWRGADDGVPVRRDCAPAQQPPKPLSGVRPDVQRVRAAPPRRDESETHAGPGAGARPRGRSTRARRVSARRDGRRARSHRGAGPFRWSMCRGGVQVSAWAGMNPRALGQAPEPHGGRGETQPVARGRLNERIPEGVAARGKGRLG